MPSVNITLSPREQEYIEVVIFGGNEHLADEIHLEKWSDEVNVVMNEAQAATLIATISQQLHDLAAEREE